MDEENKEENQENLSNDKILEELKKMNTEFRKVKKIYSDIIGLHSSFTKSEDGIKSTIIKSKEYCSTLEDAKSRVEILINNSEDKFEIIKSKYEEIEKFANEINEYKKQIEDEENGVKKVFSETVVLNDEIESDRESIKESKNDFDKLIKTSIASIEQTKEDILKKKIQIENTQSEIEEINKEMTTYNDAATSMVKSIGNILDLVTDRGLANSFDERRKRVEKSMNRWKYLLIGSVLLAVFLLVFLFGFNEKLFDWNNIQDSYMKFVFKVTLSSPLIFAIWFSSIQYSRERHILEQYEYKTATALVFEQYARILDDKFEEGFEKEKFDFITNLINKVYKETEYPKHGTELSAKIKEPFLNKEMNATAKAEEIQD